MQFLHGFGLFLQEASRLVKKAYEKTEGIIKSNEALLNVVRPGIPPRQTPIQIFLEAFTEISAIFDIIFSIEIHQSRIK